MEWTIFWRMESDGLCIRKRFVVELKIAIFCGNPVSQYEKEFTAVINGLFTWLTSYQV